MNLLLVIHPTQFCNLDCTYCWAPNRSVTKKVELAAITAALKQVLSSPAVQRIDLCWLTGEPLVMGLTHFQTVLDIYRDLVPAESVGRFVVQTNGTLLDREYAEFFARNGFTVGVSLDGPREIHDRQRPSKNGRSSHELAVRGIDHLRQAGVHGGALCVITKRTLELGAKELFAFFAERGIAWSYLIGAAIGENDGHGDNITIDDVPRLRFFLSELIDLWGSSEHAYIRDFDQFARRIYGEHEELDTNNLGCLDILNLLPNGDFFWGNPELLSATGLGLDYIKGNIATHSVIEFRNTKSFKAFERETHDGVDKCREECSYFDSCRGGNPAHKFYETGRCDTSVHTTCLVNDQLIADLFREKVPHFA